MDVFSDVYKKSIDVLRIKSLDESWAVIENDLKLMLREDGPDVSKGAALGGLRGHLAKLTKGKPAKAKAEAILAASRPEVAGFQERAAFVKTMKHFYLVEKKGNQTIWVMDSPKAYGNWTYRQFAHKNAEAVKSELEKDAEVFGGANRQMMSNALQLARKWSTDVHIKLASSDVKTMEMVTRWFHQPGATADEVKATIAILQTGFKKIAATCNSTCVIFSDRPHLRVSGDYDDTYASVNADDRMPVIYIFQEFLRTGKRNRFGVIPELWLCALTIVHELSHKLMATRDIKYDYQNLRPRPGFLTADAMGNADSWGYFTADMAGILSQDTLDQVLV